jgi:RNA polymerase sigma-70 factor (ECF subfamily)
MCVDGGPLVAARPSLRFVEVLTLDCAIARASLAFGPDTGSPSVERVRERVRGTLDAGDVAEARRLMADTFELDASLRYRDEWRELRDVTVWPDAWLIAGAREEPPDVEALDMLVNRYWKPLFGRCQLLTLNGQQANDLAQETWCRVLRARRTLRPDGNFSAYITTIATNLWRDWNRSARRAGSMSDSRMASLDAPLPTEDGDEIGLSEILPDLNALQVDEHAQLKLDIDGALARLSSQLRDVLIARYLNDESAAEIGRREGRTEQTISAWVRHALREMRLHLGESRRLPAREDTP